MPKMEKDFPDINQVSGAFVTSNQKKAFCFSKNVREKFSPWKYFYCKQL